ncbi:hypothetical protein [Actinomadura miaoliensis]|uniref:Uncharacterized protein n=1 Tax=Actinomadura miaoliensis TaxID=430685 RepID=A0ABP7W745_9ACTN
MTHYTFYSDSDPATTRLELEGAWIHDPADPAGTVRHYRFGKATRDTKIDIGGTSLTFAGRRFPVVEYGEHQDDQYGIRVQIPDGDTYRAELDDLRAFAEAKTTLVFRDNRGRQMHGTMSGYAVDDQPWGAEVSFTFTRVSIEQVTA